MKHFDVFLRKKVTETDLYIQELVQRKDLAGKDYLVLFSEEALAHLEKYIAPQAVMELVERLLPMLKTAYTTGKDKLLLTAAGKLFSTAFAGEISDELILDTTSAAARDIKYTTAEDSARLSSAPVRETDTEKYLSSESVSVLTAAMDCALWLVRRYASAQSASFLSSGLSAGSTAYSGGLDRMKLFTENPTSRLVRFRNLGETFPLTLESMQDRTLEDLILEVID